MRAASGLSVLFLLAPIATAGAGHGGAAAKPAATRHAAAGSAQKKGAGGASGTGRAADEVAVAQLGKGMRLFEAADYAAAQQTLAPLAESRLRNRDAALFLLATSEAMELPPRREQALAHFRELAAMQQSRYAPVARARAADLAFELGRLDESRAAYRAALAAPSADVEPAVAHFHLAQIAEQRAERAGALEEYRRVFDEHPAHPLAARAFTAMKRLDGTLVVSPGARIARARKLTASHAWQEALDELGLLPADLSAALRDEADYQEGMTHFKMRHGYDIAAQKLMAVWSRLSSERQADALFHGARAYSRSHQGFEPNSGELDDRAIAGYKDLVARFPRSRPAAEASFLIGWLDFNRGHYKDALVGLAENLARYGGSTFTDDAEWYLGYSKWMMGDAAGALSAFEVLARRSGALDGGKGKYWKGRALAKLGKRDAAVEEWRRLAVEYPFTYYAMSARVRLADEGIKLDVWGRDPGAAPEASRVAPLGAPDEALAADPDIERVDELLRAGLHVEAGAMLDRVDGDFLKRNGAGRALGLVIDRYEKAEDFFHVHRLAEAHGGSALRHDPHSDAGARSWWERVYPLAWRRFVEKYGPSGDNPTYYLYTIMQKESAYNPHDLSYADAIGLLQMIPPTSRRVGERIGRPYTDDVLYDPEGNIQFGAWYIGHLLAKFKGQVALGAGSYNAGPKAMMRWIKQNGARPLDEFIELCPYTQTREYMKKALDIYSRYEWLYAKHDYLPAEKIDAAFLENDIDY